MKEHPFWQDIEPIGRTLKELAKRESSPGKATLRPGLLAVELRWSTPWQRSAARGLLFLAAKLFHEAGVKEGEAVLVPGREPTLTASWHGGGERLALPNAGWGTWMPGALGQTVAGRFLSLLLGQEGWVSVNRQSARATEAAFYPTALSKAEVKPSGPGFSVSAPLGGKAGALELLESLRGLITSEEWRPYERAARTLLQEGGGVPWGGATLSAKGLFTASVEWTPKRWRAWVEPASSHGRLQVRPLSWAPTLEQDEIAEGLAYLEALGVPKKVLREAEEAKKMRAAVSPPAFLVSWEQDGIVHSAFGLLGKGVLRMGKTPAHHGFSAKESLFGLSRDVARNLWLGLKGRLSEERAAMEAL